MLNFLCVFTTAFIIELIRRFVFPTCYLIEFPSEREKQERLEEEREKNHVYTEEQKQIIILFEQIKGAEVEAEKYNNPEQYATFGKMQR